jgi:hypothetical protein
VVDAEDVFLAEDFQDFLVQHAGGFEVMAEGFLENDLCPAF